MNCAWGDIRVRQLLSDFIKTWLILFPAPHKSSKSSSSSQPPFLLLTVILPTSFSLFSATAPNSSFSCSSVTLDLSCPDLANMINRFSTSVARDSFTSRIRPRRSAASGSKICERMEFRASAMGEMSELAVKPGLVEWKITYILAACMQSLAEKLATRKDGAAILTSAVLLVLLRPLQLPRFAAEAALNALFWSWQGWVRVWYMGRRSWNPTSSKSASDMVCLLFWWARQTKYNFHSVFNAKGSRTVRLKFPFVPRHFYDVDVSSRTRHFLQTKVINYCSHSSNPNLKDCCLWTYWVEPSPVFQPTSQGSTEYVAGFYFALLCDLSAFTRQISA